MYRQCPYASTQGHFCPLSNPIFSLQFSLHFWEKTFSWAHGENTWAPPFIFLPPHPTKYTPKKFSFPFSLKSFSSILFHLQTNTPLEDRIKDPKPDKLITHLKKLKTILNLHQLMSNQKHCPFVSLQLMSRWKNTVELKCH